jgi:hypothetical protein
MVPALALVGFVAIFMGIKAISTRKIQYRRHVLRDSEGNPLQSDSLVGKSAVQAGFACVLLGLGAIVLAVLITFDFV